MWRGVAIFAFMVQMLHGIAAPHTPSCVADQWPPLERNASSDDTAARATAPHSSRFKAHHLHLQSGRRVYERVRVLLRSIQQAAVMLKRRVTSRLRAVAAAWAPHFTRRRESRLEQAPTAHARRVSRRALRRARLLARCILSNSPRCCLVRARLRRKLHRFLKNGKLRVVAPSMSLRRNASGSEHQRERRRITWCQWRQQRRGLLSSQHTPTMSPAPVRRGARRSWRSGRQWWRGVALILSMCCLATSFALYLTALLRGFQAHRALPLAILIPSCLLVSG